MNLKVTNENSPSFTEAVGIPEERVNELAKKLDEILQDLKGKKLHTWKVMQLITEICNTQEELIYCLISHCNYVAIQYGVFYCLPSDWKEKMRQKI